jgi:hypothetical protein
MYAKALENSVPCYRPHPFRWCELPLFSRKSGNPMRFGQVFLVVSNSPGFRPSEPSQPGHSAVQERRRELRELGAKLQVRSKLTADEVKEIVGSVMPEIHLQKSKAYLRSSQPKRREATARRLEVHEVLGVRSLQHHLDRRPRQ